MKKLKHKYHYDNIYLMGFVFLLNVDTDKQIEKILKNKYRETYKFYKKEKTEGSNISIEKSGGKCILGQHRTIIIIKKQKGQSEAECYDVLAHECLHATMHTLGERGVRYDIGSHNEHFTYYLSYLVREALSK